MAFLTPSSALCVVTGIDMTASRPPSCSSALSVVAAGRTDSARLTAADDTVISVSATAVSARLKLQSRLQCRSKPDGLSICHYTEKCILSHCMLDL